MRDDEFIRLVARFSVCNGIEPDEAMDAATKIRSWMRSIFGPTEYADAKALEGLEFLVRRDIAA